MSDTHPGAIVLAPSRTRRRLLEGAAAVISLVALALATAGTAPGLCAAAFCAVSAAAAIRQARHAAPASTVQVDGCADFRAWSASRMRVVFFAAQRQVVVWHDATDPATYRRLAIRARWQPRGQSR